jgi:dUTPase
MFLKLQNEGDKDYVVNKGDAICQGMFVKYLTVENETNDFKERISDY